MYKAYMILMLFLLGLFAFSLDDSFGGSVGGSGIIGATRADLPPKNPPTDPKPDLPKFVLGGGGPPPPNEATFIPTVNPIDQKPIAEEERHILRGKRSVNLKRL